jgi:ribosomal protein S4E
MQKRKKMSPTGRRWKGMLQLSKAPEEAFKNCSKGKVAVDGNVHPNQRRPNTTWKVVKKLPQAGPKIFLKRKTPSQVT